MLGDDIAYALIELQQQAESRMVDTCAIVRALATSGSTWNDTTGRYERNTSQVYAGPCRVRAQDTQPTNPVAGEAEYNETGYVVSLPMSVVAVHVGDVITITASARDLALVGRVFIVTSVSAQTDQTARRLAVKEVT